jgi:hypothetical protein
MQQLLSGRIKNPSRRRVLPYEWDQIVRLSCLSGSRLRLHLETMPGPEFYRRRPRRSNNNDTLHHFWLTIRPTTLKRHAS